MKRTGNNLVLQYLAAGLLVLCVLSNCRTGVEKIEKEPARRAPRVTLGQPVIVMLGPPGDLRWGYYSFPDMWRAPAGEMYLAVNVGEDANDVGEHLPTQFFVSRDEGKSWQPILEDQVDFSPDIIALPGGGQVAFGTEKYIYHYSTYGPRQRELHSLDELGLKSVFTTEKSRLVAAHYRYGDLPQKLSRIPMKRREGPDALWQHEYAHLDPSDLLLRAPIRAPDAAGDWSDITPMISTTPRDAASVLWPERLVVLPDGTLLWPLASQDPGIQSMFFRVQCVASSDGGRTWGIRGTIADQPELADWGYGCGEQSMQRMPNGDLLCVMRTRMAGNTLGTRPLTKSTHSLAATRSSDNGYTWSRPQAIAPLSVTPHLRTLENGTVGVVYGRPGVHVRASADSGQTWSEAFPVVGPKEAQLMAESVEERMALSHGAQRSDQTKVLSCSNTDVVVTGPDRFIVSYSDFQYRDEEGRQRKAIKVREVIVEMPE